MKTPNLKSTMLLISIALVFIGGFLTGFGTALLIEKPEPPVPVGAPIIIRNQDTAIVVMNDQDSFFDFSGIHHVTVTPMNAHYFKKRRKNLIPPTP